ncbi:hypothetical protein C4K08_5395 [Pseudomonas chlororaphis subsp. aureofaciens]|nr:hypothetical protein C4K08_5395 [Pseudomonas chlororaphis subsp. aureofaciens]
MLVGVLHLQVGAITRSDFRGGGRAVWEGAEALQAARLRATAISEKLASRR